MRIFVLGLPHTQTTTEFTTCAYTMKVWNLCRMMKERGHHVVHLGVEGSNPVCSENVDIVSREMWENLYGHPGEKQYTTKADGKYAILHKVYGAEGKRALLERCMDPNTAIICAPWGGCQREAVKDVPQYAVESGIGYHHTWSPYRVFESYAWLHFHMGRENRHQGKNWYDVVIPNSFDPAMFPFVNKKKRKDHFLYIGRLNDDKGLPIALDVTKRIGAKLMLVGQTHDGNPPTKILTANPHATYHKSVGVEERKQIMGEAKAAFVPTQYLEPFGGVAVELMMTGCPVITSDFGVFSETVLHGVTGYRGRTMEQFVWAANNIDKIKNIDCRNWAVDNYSTERVAPMYEEYFQQVLNLRGGGFYQQNPKRDQLSWLQKSYPKGATQPIFLTPKHIEPKIDSTWEAANKWESDWWGLTPNARWIEEINKQRTYARLIGISHDVDVKNKRILDVGCGPTSIMLRAKNLGRSVGIDPIHVSDTTLHTYAKKGVFFENVKAEDYRPARDQFDEAWMYNCLQHTEDPNKILQMLALSLPEVRIFEWINMGVCPGHPQNLTEEMFAKFFRNDKWDRPIWNTGVLHDFGGTVTNNYIAIHAIRKK